MSAATEILEEVMKDVQQDSEDFDGQPFTGKVVGTYFGYHGAAIYAVAKLLKELMEDMDAKTAKTKE